MLAVLQTSQEFGSVFLFCLFIIKWVWDINTPFHLVGTAAKSLQSCLTLCDPTDSSPPGSPVPGILQATTLEWVAISFSNAWKWKVKVKSLSCIWLFVTPWTAAYQAPLSMGFSRQEYWSGVSLPSLGSPIFKLIGNFLNVNILYKILHLLLFLRKIPHCHVATIS